jgi:hypothetical protein
VKVKNLWSKLIGIDMQPGERDEEEEAKKPRNLT